VVGARTILGPMLLRNRRLRRCAIALGAALTGACDEALDPQASLPDAAKRAGAFVDVSESAGITATEICGEALKPKRWILEVNGSGVALFDMDGDGDLDAWLTNGSTLAALRAGRPGAGNTLWRNDGAGRFADATAGAGLEGSRWGNGAAVGDVDNDGDLD